MGSFVKNFLVIHGLITWYIWTRPKANKDDLSVRVKAKNIPTVRVKAEIIFIVRTKAKIIFAKFVRYLILREYNFHIQFKGLLKNSYNKPQYLS